MVKKKLHQSAREKIGSTGKKNIGFENGEKYNAQKKFNFLSKDQRNKTEAPDPGEGPYQRFKYYKKLKRARLI